MRVPSIRVFLWMTAALLTVTMLSCGRDEGPEEPKQEEEKVVNDWETEDIDGDATMSSQVMRFSVGNIPSITRGITPFSGASYTFSVGDRITIELTRDDVVVGTKVYKVTNTDGDLEFDYDNYPTGQPFYLENKNDFQLRAWSYGNSTPFATDPVGSSFTLNTDQRTNTTTDNYTELLYSPKQSYSYSTEKIPIKLYHQMARLKVTLTHEASGDLSVDYVKIGNSSIPTTATFSESGIDIENEDFMGTWTGHSSTTTQVYARADKANENYTAVLFPNTSLSGKLINVVTDNETKTYAYTLPSSVSFNPGNQYSYTITVKDGKVIPTTSDVGKVLAADGKIYATVSAAKNAGTTASGLIAYVGSAGSVDASSSSYSCLVLSLTDANSGNVCAWFTSNSGTCVNQTSTTATALTYMNGIACTNTLVNSNGSGVTSNCKGHTHAAARAARNYGTTRPDGASEWFLPTLGQWNLIVKGLMRVTEDLTGASNSAYISTEVNKKITPSGATGLVADDYWISTERTEERAWYISFHPSYGGYMDADGKTSASNYVRAVFAY